MERNAVFQGLAPSGCLLELTTVGEKNFVTLEIPRVLWCRRHQGLRIIWENQRLRWKSWSLHWARRTRCFSLAVAAACSVAKAALMPDENTFLFSPLARIRMWGGGGVSGWYQTRSCLVTKGEALRLLRVPALWKWQPEAAPDQVPGSSFSLLLPTETVSGGNGRFVASQGQLQHCVSMTLQLQRQRSAGAGYKVPHTWIWGTPPYKSAWGLPRGVAWGKEHPLACCLQCTTHTHDEMWGLLRCSRHLHYQGTSAQTVTPKPEESSVPLEMWSHSRWNAGSHGDSFASRQPQTRRSPHCRHGHFLAWPW